MFVVNALIANASSASKPVKPKAVPTTDTDSAELEVEKEEIRKVKMKLIIEF